jgi:protein-disulfide isomerase
MPTRTPPATSTKPPGTSSGRRQRAAELRDSTRRAERRKKRITIGVAVALVMLVIGGIAVQAMRSTADSSATVPSGTTADGYGVMIGAPDAPVLVELYEDFMCPACGRFEEATGDELREMTADERVRLVYRPMAFLDGASTTRYSTRALNAAACAVDAGRFSQYHSVLFSSQPDEGGPGLSDDTLVALGSDAGVTGSEFAGCVQDLQFESWTRGATDAASKAGVVQTPTVLIDGQPLADMSLEGLRQAVAAAGS